MTKKNLKQKYLKMISTWSQKILKKLPQNDLKMTPKIFKNDPQIIKFNKKIV